MRALSDTPIEMERLQAAILARKSPQERMQLGLAMSSAMLRRSQASLIERMAACGSTREGALIRWVELHYGADLARGFAAAARPEEPPEETGASA